ncbi:ArsR/SmtB family transcription factor [Pelagicoccus albus]|uniref:Helix-turn-helix transcriptional regulator n=1 Tax=Pelagicoccus albus TaxID=415222 RepID=A0A7X1B6S8_9BACT|nr:metalloregulator ArsR/SmtB family transcription factor [Pelagicoccus albus]MBC2606702.1 helix-turn-helix transcriptional regulator [Pelagicoccus albus]
MNVVEVTKALANETRFDIVRWLGDPEGNFRPHKDGKDFSDGVCVAVIQEKTGMSQSTTSHYLSILQRSDLVVPVRIGKWTYYSRNEATIKAYIKELKTQL